ncbi:MAG: DUF1772 domain-containing protein [Candidatus Poribacteria bacterium]|nr:DUF1772 domain-containing protein [Candidatus Poribacteria bacterium]
MVHYTTRSIQFCALLFTGAIFGFFYAYVVSCLNGLSTLSARDAIEAMNAINIAVRNFGFMPVFFFTPLVCLAAAGLSLLVGERHTSFWIFAAATLYFFGALLPTIFINVPMNDGLKEVDPNSLSLTIATDVWNSYAREWQFWNIIRTFFSGLALVSLGAGLMKIRS